MFVCEECGREWDSALASEECARADLRELNDNTHARGIYRSSN